SEMNNNALNVEVIGVLPTQTSIYQTNDGTTYLFQAIEGAPMRLFVLIRGKQVFAKLPSDIITVPETDGDAMYFASDGKIYSAVLNETNEFTVQHVRDKLPLEEFHDSAFCVHDRYLLFINKGKYTYRMWDNPARD
ncbi:hypothetical protein PMAYCL1PPCAC_09410, partial [Pristionchus mayeri]